MPMENERRPEAEAPTPKAIFGKLDMEEHLEEIGLARELAIRALDQVVDPDQPTLTIEELRAKLDQELPGVSLSKLIMDERELGY